jgi:hypothetical protein
MKVQDLKIGQTVYHRDVYRHKEPLKIVGIKETEVELEGDFSGMYNVKQRQWMPLKGLSRIYNHAYKLECRKQAITMETLAIPVDSRNQDNMTRAAFDLQHMVMMLTTDVELNPEI